MLAQHLITRPVFDALFANYPFTKQNPVSSVDAERCSTSSTSTLEKETATLDKFYAFGRRDRAEGIDNAEGRQKVI